MQLAKQQIDIGLSTNHVEVLLGFWQGEAGAQFDHVLPVLPGQDQHRHYIAGTVLKINHHEAHLPANPPSGYRELVIARSGLAEPRSLADPEGNRVMLVPPGSEGVHQIGVRIAVRDIDAHRRFYGDSLGLPEERPGVFRARRERDPPGEESRRPGRCPAAGSGLALHHLPGLQGRRRAR